jgi:hypothetical protein
MRRAALALAAVFALNAPAHAQDTPCKQPQAIHISIGDDEYWIPTRQGPKLAADEGETRLQTDPRLAYCQAAGDAPWRVRSVIVVVRNILPNANPRGPAQGLAKFSIISLQKREAQYAFPDLGWHDAKGPYRVSPNGQTFLSKADTFLGAKLQISASPGFAATLISPIGKETVAQGTAALANGQMVPSQETIAAMAQLITDWKRPK